MENHFRYFNIQTNPKNIVALATHSIQLIHCNYTALASNAYIWWINDLQFYARGSQDKIVTFNFYKNRLI